ncbi:hypothetical protein VD0002_g8986 [Verticillium dahliae]|uniref:DUF2241 domain-containing protein n=2 Tax=Verticillium dahliae TaxID=27337 RepID=G2WYN0_VERDV|nr:uncharacterized protein VDAG_03122 [Verticillium dahliae VdLs.17]KAF3344911.1 Bromodomain-containing factor 1 [Verticillium dahliae VDG2]KAH6703502.1 ACT domain-containing protein [Verticillium dahliae]EGY21682.1 hypothetical protein VDAG_03122 [Verticillium dahliae VdLs.17]PNH29267.1 hypothetical protein BJF96_g7442 [Verticillium dahliae]PNH49764.1 hypothetical protein VD0003_g7390 [Verticillium dahliae]
MAVTVGEKSLQKLLATLTTVLHPSTYVFVTLPQSATPPPLSEVQMIFREAEGSTVIMKLEDAKARAFDYAFPSRMITLNVHSSLEAVGFLAVITARLAATGMGVNPVSGYFHDHLFVPEGREADALAVLQAIAVENRNLDTGEAS